MPLPVAIERLNPCGGTGETAVLIRAVSRWSLSNPARPARTTGVTVNASGNATLTLWVRGASTWQAGICPSFHPAQLNPAQRTVATIFQGKIPLVHQSARPAPRPEFASKAASPRPLSRNLLTPEIRDGPAEPDRNLRFTFLAGHLLAQKMSAFRSPARRFRRVTLVRQMRNPLDGRNQPATDVLRRAITAAPENLGSLSAMERTGGEPDATGQDRKSGEFIFTDCSAQSPAGRQSAGHDRAALAARKDHQPRTSATDRAEARGADLLAEEHDRELQKLGEFGSKSSGWVIAPADIRKLGRALFGDRRSGRVLICPNGAQSYFAGRGFRSSLRV